MGFGIGAGPEGAAHHQTTRYAYDIRSGAILATFHFVGAPKLYDEELHRQVSRQVQETSTISAEHIAILSEAQLPEGEGSLRVDVESKQLIRSVHHVPQRILA